MTAAAPIVWGHALAALLFGALAVAQLRDPRGESRSLPFIVALALTALWALAVAGIGSQDLSVRMVEPLRDLAWLAALFAVLRRDAKPGLAITATYGVVGAVALLSVAVAVSAGEAIASTAVLLRMMTAVAALVLAHHLAAAAPASRGGLRLALVALAAMWTIDLLIYATAYAADSWPDALVAARGFAMALVAATLVVATERGGDWTLKPSRMIAIRSLSLAAIALYVVAVVLTTGVFANVGGDYARLLQTAFVAGATATLIGVVASPWLRAWVKVKVAKHLFDHRYDYRHEWLRFTATLARPDAAADPLEQRVVKALADLTDSPGGLLLVADGDALSTAATWNWSGEGPCGPDFTAHLAATDRIVDLDTLRVAHDAEAAVIPQWLFDRTDAWAIVPLVHHGQLTGAVVLARPPVARALDWEDFDLLRVAGRQGASYLAEGRAAAALGEAQRFDEFNRRFAFIIHDVKNLVSQLTLVARNAERHADNPAFRADMIATLQDSCGRMSALLQRLSQHSGSRAEAPRATDVGAIVQRIARQRRGQHPVVVSGSGAVALVDPARFEQIVGHLVQNAIEASGPDAPVTIAVEASHDSVTVAVVDTGAGMTAAFIRDELFRPFTSSKAGGFGIGAFEARQLTEAMGGRIAVASRPGRGTRFAVSFPAALALEIAA
ncbi:MAG: XrtA/PEP-CTERM system histidine kinase PrsK [Pseudomonadota bacterium]